MPDVITGLSAELIAPRLFPTRRWYAASPLWYYHAPRTTGRMRTDHRFFELIDPDLRDACRLLQDAGLRTTPSCQGHFYPRAWFEAIWDDLVREAPRIRGAGLPVTDSEDDREYLFRDPRYRLPWPSFDAFFAQIRATQTEGYLGFVVPASRAALVDELERAPYRERCAELSRDRDVEPDEGALFTLQVRPRDPAERRREWECATLFLRRVLGRAA